jgi:hypothetical protein
MGTTPKVNPSPAVSRTLLRDDAKHLEERSVPALAGASEKTQRRPSVAGVERAAVRCRFGWCVRLRAIDSFDEGAGVAFDVAVAARDRAGLVATGEHDAQAGRVYAMKKGASMHSWRAGSTRRAP